MSAIKVQRIIAFIGLGLFIIKILAYFFTGSVAILTDALESIVNVITGFFGLYSVLLAAKPRDNDHPLGHGKIEFISAGIEGTLIIIAGGFIVYQAIQNFIHPKPVENLGWGTFLVAASGIINFLAGRFAIHQGRKSHSLTVEAAGHHICSDAYSSFGLVLGLALLYFTNWQWLDSIMALVFAIIIFITGYQLLRKSIGGIMDEANESITTGVISALEKNRKPEWIDLHNVRVLKYGDFIHFDAHITLPYYFTVLQADVVMHEIEHIIKNECIVGAETFLHVDACKEFSCPICTISDCPVRQHEFVHKIPWTSELLWKDAKHGQ